jgi:DNA-directed RNA polymerase specialized sigma24 family protein
MKSLTKHSGKNDKPCENMLTKSFGSYTSTETQDLIISKRILNGEKELFALLLKPHNKSLYCAIRSVIKNDDLIQKALMTSYANAFKYLYSFYGQCSFRIWLLSIGIREANKLVNHSQGIVESENPSSEGIRALAEYPRIVFALRRILSLTNKEISACLGISSAQVKKHEVIARKELNLNFTISTENRDFKYDHDFLIEQFMNQQNKKSSDVDANSGNFKTKSIQMESDMEIHDDLNPIQQLKQEHSKNLALCANIRTGFARGVEVYRIKSYTDWYWNNFLTRHFSSEEKMIFPILGKENPLVRKAVSEHKRLRRLFESRQDIHKMLNRIEEELEEHVRFEERVLFKEIEKTGNAKDIETIDHLHGQEGLVWKDEFWR